jgi:V/A-type H+-transporting ATPase subunit K
MLSERAFRVAGHGISGLIRPAPSTGLARSGKPSAKGGSPTGCFLYAAAIATGLAAVGAGIAVATTGSAALGSVAERPELFGCSPVYVGLAEGIAIHGVIVAILILAIALSIATFFSTAKRPSVVDALEPQVRTLWRDLLAVR